MDAPEIDHLCTGSGSLTGEVVGVASGGEDLTTVVDEGAEGEYGGGQHDQHRCGHAALVSEAVSSQGHRMPR
jgi:hypothetical protein